MRKGNRGELLEVAQKEVAESYTFKKGKSHSKMYGSWKDKVPTPKCPKFEREMRDNRVTELNEVIVDLTKRIAIKESRCQSRSTTPGLASTPLSSLSNFPGSYSCDASASSESESTVMSQVHIVQLPSQDRDFSCRNQ